MPGDTLDDFLVSVYEQLDIVINSRKRTAVPQDVRETAKKLKQRLYAYYHPTASNPQTMLSLAYLENDLVELAHKLQYNSKAEPEFAAAKQAVKLFLAHHLLWILVCLGETV